MRRRNRVNGERGGIIVELAMVVPILLMLILGMFEVGTAWNESQTVVQASRSGARTISQLGTYGSADQQAVLAVISTFGDDIDDIERVIVFDASSGSDFPTACNITPTAVATGVNGVCNVYGQSAFDDADDPAYFDSNGDVPGSGCGGGASRFWCPDGAGRSSNQVTATEVGVYVEFNADRATGFFGSTPFSLSRTTVMRIEPRDT